MAGGMMGPPPGPHRPHPHQQPGQQPPPQQAVKKARRVVDEPDLPEGWAAAESNGKVYYFHKVTKKVQWKRPGGAE